MFFSSIRTRTLSYLGLFYLVLVFITISAYVYGIPLTQIRGAYEQYQAESLNDLNLIANLKRRTLQTWIDERQSDARLLATSLEQFPLGSLYEAIQQNRNADGSEDRLSDDLSHHPAYQQLAKYLQRIHSQHRNFIKTEIIDAASRRLILSITSGKDQPQLFASIISQLDLKSNLHEQVFFVDDEKNDYSALHLSIPLAVPGYEHSLLLLAHIDMEPILSSITENQALWQFHELLIVDMNQRIIAPKAHEPDRRMITHADDQLVRLAIGGNEGTLVTRDFRNIPVLAAYRYIHVNVETGLGMVVKRDLSSIMIPVTNTIYEIIILGIFSLLLGFIIMALIFNYQLRPLVLLSEKAQEVERGNWNIQVTPVFQKDEIGQLTHAFNSMLVRIRQGYETLEKQVETRTFDLKCINEELEEEIEERKSVENQLLASEGRFRTLFDGISDGIIFVDSERRFHHVNPAICHMTGYTASELKNISVDEIYLHQDPAYIQKQFDLMENGTLSMLENVPVKRKNGSTFKADVSIILLNLEQPYLVGIFRDITQRQLLEEEIRQAHKMEALGTMAGGIAHDFNNILQGIIVSVELVKRKLGSGADKLNEILNETLLITNRGADIVRQLLTFSRQDEPEFQIIQLIPIIKEALKMMRSALPSTIEIKEDIDYTCHPILGNVTQIHQVLINLCNNAGHAMRERGGFLRVGLSEKTFHEDSLKLMNLSAGHCYLQLKVTDTGTGIPKDALSRIFDPFFTTKEVGEGTGLGLAVVYSIVKNHNGGITVESKEGVGTCFCVYFPIVEEKVFEEMKKEVAIQGGSEHLLVVDDEDMVLTMVTMILEEYGYKVTTARNGQEALNCFRSQADQIELVITDLTMPEMTGTELSVALLKIRPGLPIILTTGYGHTISEDLISEIGIRKYLQKPFELNDLMPILREILDHP
ncbi:ATP-binding protein [Deltaproteobacteria bacterium TL4]